MSVIAKNNIDIKGTHGYNRAVYIDKLNHLDKLPTTSIVLTKLALKEHVAKPISLVEFKDLADEMNNDDDNMQVESQVGVLIVETQAPVEAMRKTIRKFLDQGHPLSGAWKVPIVSSEDAKFINISSANESNGATNDQDDGIYEQVKKAINDPEYERKLDARIEEAYANKMQSDKFLREEDFTVYPEFMDGTNKQIEHAAQHNIDVINSVFHTNTAKFVNTKEEKDEEY